MERFFCNTALICGEGALEQLASMEIRRLLLVTDPFFMSNGVAQKVAQQSGAEHWEIFDRVLPDPTLELAAEGTAVVQQFQPDTVVALGGGSAMDCAKAMVYFSGLKCRLIAVPTTSGSGSEVTDFAILTHGGVKHPLVDERLRPNTAILDAKLLEQLPRSVIADGGFDVLCHAAEACVAANAGPITNALAVEAFRTVYGLLLRSWNGERQVRQQIHTAATMAGMAFSGAGLGLCHALAHSIGGVFHIPHGRINAILLPAVIGYNEAAAGTQYALLAQGAGMGSGAQTLAVRNLKNGLIRLRTQLQMPATLAQAGAAPDQVRQQIDSIVQAAMEDPCCKTNPAPVTAAGLRGLLGEVLGRG